MLNFIYKHSLSCQLNFICKSRNDYANVEKTASDIFQSCHSGEVKLPTGSAGHSKHLNESLLALGVLEVGLFLD